MIKFNFFGSKYSVFKKQVIRLNLLRNLKRLKIHSPSWIRPTSRLTSHLHLFEQLEQLELEFGLEENCDLSISHSNLRIVSIHGDFFGGKFDLNTEKLEVLKFTDDFDSFYITHPSSIKHLTAPLSNLSGQSSKLTSFTNLEYFHVCCSTTFGPIVLTQLPKLKELKFVTEGDYCELIEDARDYSDVKQMIIGLIRMKQTLQRKELKLYFDDVPLTGVKQFNRILRDQFGRFAGSDDSDQSMDEDDVNPNDEGMEINDNNNGNNGEDNGDGDQDVIIID